MRGRTVIVVDDGLATGLTDLAAVRALRARGAARIVVAVPVGSREAVALLREEADEVVCHTIPPSCSASAAGTGTSRQVSDDEVLALLAAGRRPDAATAAEPTGTRAARSRSCSTSAASACAATSRVPADARGLVIFAHGSGSSRLSPRNRMVARRLERGGSARRCSSTS